MKIIWISDLHFEPSEDVSSGADPTARIQLVIDEINQKHTDAAYCILTGDLVNDAEPAHYPMLKAILDQTPLPLLPLVGNHDDRAALLGTFTPPVEPGSSFVQYSVDTHDGRLICLDTHTIGDSKGTLCEARYAWLENTLNEADSDPCYIFMHHPPAKLMLGVLDEISLEDHEKFIDLVKDYPQVNHIFCGHVHRPISASIGGIPLSVMPSMRVQAPLPYPLWNWDEFVATGEAPMFGVIHINEGNSIVQYQQFDF